MYDEQAQKLLVLACHEAMQIMPAGKLSRLYYELDWRGKTPKTFRDWFFGFFASYRSSIFVNNHPAIVELLNKDWREVRDLVKFAYASRPSESEV